MPSCVKPHLGNSTSERVAEINMGSTQGQEKFTGREVRKANKQESKTCLSTLKLSHRSTTQKDVSESDYMVLWSIYHKLRIRIWKSALQYAEQ